MEKPTIVYALDPLCGWCFAFTDTAATLRRELGDDVNWAVACGGLVVGERVSPIAQAADYLRAGMKAVEARTPARFGDDFRAVLDDGTWISNSEPACRAVLLVQRHFGGGAAVDFAGALSQGFYQEGHVPDAPESLALAAGRARIDICPIMDVWASDEARSFTKDQFRKARSEGLNSYPSLFLRTDQGLERVLSGWAAPYDALARLRAAIAGVTVDP